MHSSCLLAPKFTTIGQSTHFWTALVYFFLLTLPDGLIPKTNTHVDVFAAPKKTPRHNLQHQPSINYLARNAKDRRRQKSP